MNLGFVGLGIMGSAMAANLLKAGFKVTVWNRSADKCLPLADLGAGVADSPRAVAECSDKRGLNALNARAVRTQLGVTSADSLVVCRAAPG